MASFLYNGMVEAAAKGEIDFDADSFKALLVTSSYTPSNSHEFRSSVTNEVTGTGYTAGGVAITQAVTRDDANNRVDVDFDPVQYNNVTLTCRGMVIYKNTGSAGTDRLIAYVDLGSNKSPAGVNLLVTLSSPLRFQK